VSIIGGRAAYVLLLMAGREGSHTVAHVSYGNAGALIKRSITDLVRAGCRVERIAHDPPAVSFVAPDGSPSALRVDGRVYVLASPHGLQRFHSLDAALSAVTRPRLEAAS
jgi:hypothetical protein